MARMWRQTRPLIMRDEYVEVADTEDGAEYRAGIVEQIIDAVGAVLVSVLALRFLLSLFGANPANAFANFIYSVTHPLVAPFTGMFSFGPRLGDARIEVETIIAIIVCGVLTMILAWIVSLPRRRSTY